MPPEKVDVEWIALRAGLRPAVRLSFAPGEGAAAAARFERHGASVLVVHGVLGPDARPADVVYLARSRRDALALRDAEAPILDPARKGQGHVRAAASLETGRRLGYPVCCVEAFCARAERGSGQLADGGPPAAERYVTAREAWVARPHARTNTLLLDAGVRLITFEPCRYDCAVASRYADAVFDAIRARQPAVAHALDRALARPVVVAPSGLRALATLAPLPSPRVAHAEPPRALDDRVLDPEEAAFAARLRDLPVGPHGELALDDAPRPAVLVDFSAATTPAPA